MSKIELKELSTGMLIKLLGMKEVNIIDVRPIDAYNGWKLKDEARGGHIQGAKSLPIKWADYMDWIEVVRHKQILQKDHIVVYGYTPDQSQKVAELFLKAGYREVSVYNGFVDEWAARDEYPLEKLERYRQLVYPEWIKTVQDGGTPPEHSGEKTVICHAHYRNRNAYLTGHIPGAIDIDTLALEASETWNRRTPEELKAALEQHGIDSDTTVILYGKYMDPDNDDEFPGSAAGHIGAIRCAFIMMYAGVKDVRILNGGFQSWKDAGYEISSLDIPKEPIAEFGESIPGRPELAVDVPEAKKMIQSSDADLVCVRSYPEYIGEVSGYNYIEPKGRIPGAVFASCGSDAYHMENYRNVDHTTREFHETAKIWKESGITPDKHLAFYCGTGWRGSEAWINAWLMGWPRVSVFDGGWFEWSSDPDNPFQTGISEKIMTEIELLIDQYKDEERLGPGSDTETEKALNLIEFSQDQSLKILDIGCGTGSQTFTLARNLNGHITAVDLFPEFLEKLNLKAKDLGYEKRITTKACSMDELPYRENEFDLIWSEGAIYNMGFEKGVKEWQRFIKPGGYLAVSEASWITGARPKEVEEYWLGEYPEMDTISNKLKVLEENGYAPVAHFILPEYCWMENFYLPLQEGFSKFLSRHDNDEASRAIVEGEKREIEIYEKYGAYYSYGFYIAKKI